MCLCIWLIILYLFICLFAAQCMNYAYFIIHFVLWINTQKKNDFCILSRVIVLRKLDRIFFLICSPRPHYTFFWMRIHLPQSLLSFIYIWVRVSIKRFFYFHTPVFKFNWILIDHNLMFYMFLVIVLSRNRHIHFFFFGSYVPKNFNEQKKKSFHSCFFLFFVLSVLNLTEWA